MERLIIVGYSEIGLKGRNRGMFENRLVHNIAKCMKWHKLPYTKIKRGQGRIHIYTQAKAIPALRRVFGIHSLAYGLRVPYELVEEAITSMLSNRKFRSFRVSCQRLNKQFPKKSQEIASELGSFIKQRYNAAVKLKDYELNVGVEISDAAYVFTERKYGFGGLPVGVEGGCNALIDSEDALLAAILVMRRGCTVVPVVKGRVSLKPLEQYAFEQVKPHKEFTYPVVVLGDTFPNLTKLEQVELRPLIGMSKQEILLMKQKYF